ncbi:EAL domain-containing protein (putative c-di-GMP-specific phosphodiesterase class I) [Sphingomonas sp. BE270]|nr:MULTISPECIES: EAL domain-containing protein [unclassified Sphingomonas]MDR6849106.1 EAL domain-containing protein (putative c-di-GMP-specific phosphodiesterase class I) [Sphingomonas sp. BE137]MDR7259367.1 EAL domain-containing protein (putative c-di-GMP-specific phosphodiesterase class I) [Sphingomonas sp. BE270]
MQSGIDIAPRGDPSNTWQIVCLVEIANFSALRRKFGRVGADSLALDLERRIAAVLPDSSTMIVSRTSIEVSLERASFAALGVAVDVLRGVAEIPLDLDGEAHALQIEIGGAAAPLATIETVRLIEEAEGALEDARSTHQPVLRDLSVCTPTFDRQTLTREMPAAIANGEMFLQYQPKVHVREQRISSAEALVRWQHPNRGLILPGDFITVAEQAQQISALTLWTLDEVIRDQKVLAADGHDLTIFINISGQLLSDKHFVEAACAKTHNCGAKIGFEITETAVIRDPECAISNLQIFADRGIVIAIDDYGAGLSSLAYLKQLPARELKIDKMFVLQLTSSNRDPLIVRSTIDLAHALDMEVTAEGVETQAAMALLSVMGCDMVQGYLISRPISIDAFRCFLHEYRARPAEDDRQSMFKRPATFWKSA